MQVHNYPYLYNRVVRDYYFRIMKGKVLWIFALN